MAKSPEAFRTISEASDELGVAQHVLRFWETKFSFVRPMKRAGGRRFYRPQDIGILATVRRLLHEEGYTIRGVQKLHRERGLKAGGAGVNSGAATAKGAAVRPGSVASQDLPPETRRRIETALAALTAAKSRLDALIEHG